MAAAAEGPNEEAIVCLLGLNGLRVSEVRAAQIEDLRREPCGRSLRVHGKGGKEVSVPLNARTERAVLAAAAGRSSGPIVRRPGDRRRRPGSVAPLRPYNRQAVYERLVEIGQAAGLIGNDADKVDKLHPHVLRHSFVTLLFDAGVPLAAVQDAARHASPETTRGYDRARNAFKEHPTHRLSFGG